METTVQANHSSSLKKMAPRIAGFYFFYYATIGAFLPFWSLYLEETGFGKNEIGYLIAVTMIARIFAPSVWGYLTDKTGRRMLWIRIATLAELLAWLAIFFVPTSFVSYLVIMLFFSFFQNAIIPQFESVTLFWLGDKRDKYGQLRLWGSVGFIVTVTALGFVFDVLSLSLLPVMLAGLACLSLINAMLVSEPEQASSSSGSESSQQHDSSQIQNLSETSDSFLTQLKRPQIAWFFLAQFILLLSHAPFYTFYSNYLASYGYSKTTIGILWSLGVVAEILLFTQSKRILKRFSEFWLLWSCFAVTALRWLLVALFPESLTIQVLAQCCHAFSFALFQAVAMQFIFHVFESNQQGRAQALYSSFWGLGVAVGSVIAGQFWDSTGGAFWFMLAGVVIGVFSLIWLWLTPRWT